MEAAIDWLRAKGLAKAAKKAGRVAAEGLIGLAGDDKEAAVVEVNSETDFVAKSDEFQDAANDIAMHAAAARPRWITRDDVPQDAIDEEEAKKPKKKQLPKLRKLGRGDAISTRGGGDRHPEERRSRAASRRTRRRHRPERFG